MGPARVCVVGAGIIGLSTAYNILTSLPDADVTIVAEGFPPDVTSNVAAGFWWPHVVKDTPVQKQGHWGRVTFDYLLDLNYKPDSSNAGVQKLSGSCIFRHQEPDPAWKDDVIGFRHLSAKEMEYYPDFVMGYGFTTLLCEQAIYLPWLMEKFKAKGGHTQQKKLKSLQELFEQFDVIVNCSGLGSSSLIGDKHMEPVRGQILKVEAPWCKHFLISQDGEHYILPALRTVTLGGTHQHGDWGLDIREEDRKYIFDGCCKLEPNLKTSRIVTDGVGLRPVRTVVRLETENLQYNGKTVQVVHNYGHGGSGVTLFWGCAVEAKNLVKKALQKHQRTLSKL